MITRISEKIAIYFINYDAIKQDEYDVYTYAITKIIGTFLSVCGALLLALLLGRMFETVVYVVSFLSLRKYSGGYHSQSKILCFLSFQLLLVMDILLMEPLIQMLSWPLKMLLIIFSAGCLLCFAPVNHPDFDANQAEWKAMRKKMTLIVFIHISTCLLLYATNLFPLIGDYIVLSMCGVSLLVLLAKILKQEVV